MNDLPPPPPGGLPGPPDGRGALPPLPVPPNATGSPERRRRFAGPIIGVAAGLILVITAAGVLVADERPQQGCSPGEFGSQRFGYCIKLPNGWLGVASGKGSRFEVTGADLVQNATTPTTVLISASPIEEGGLHGFIEGVQQRGAETGLVWQGDPSHGEVGGAPSTILEGRSLSRTAAMRVREILFVRDGSVWRIQLTDQERTFDSSVLALDRILGTWRFV